MDTIFNDITVRKSCKNPLKEDKKIMARNWMDGQKRFFSGKTVTEDFDSIMGYLKASNVSRQNKLYV